MQNRTPRNDGGTENANDVLNRIEMNTQIYSHAQVDRTADRVRVPRRLTGAVEED